MAVNDFTWLYLAAHGCTWLYTWIYLAMKWSTPECLFFVGASQSGTGWDGWDLWMLVCKEHRSALCAIGRGDTLFVNSIVCDAHNTQHLLGNSAPVQNEFHIGQCGFVGSSRECRLHNRAKLGWKIQIDPPNPSLDLHDEKQFKLIFSMATYFENNACVVRGVWLCWRRVRAKSTFSFVMQLNTTAAYNWGQCSLISSFFHMTIPRSSHIGGQTTTMNTPSICIRFHNVFHIFDKLSSLWILWFDICRHMGQFLQDGENAPQTSRF